MCDNDYQLVTRIARNKHKAETKISWKKNPTKSVWKIRKLILHQVFKEVTGDMLTTEGSLKKMGLPFLRSETPTFYKRGVPDSYF